MIIAKKVLIIQKNGMRKDYTHVIKINTEMFNNDPTFCINGETGDSFGMRYNVHDRYLIKDIELMITEFYIPPSK